MKYKRLILGFIVIFLLITMMVYSSQEYFKNNPQTKRYKQLFMNSTGDYNTEIGFSAAVLSVNTTNHTLRVSIQEEPYNYPTIELHASTLDIQNLKKGNLIDVIGIYHGHHQMTATQIWLNDPSKITFIYLVSLLAIPYVFYLFFRTWRFNTTAWRFEWRKKDA